jgi:hypothetical protein
LALPFRDLVPVHIELLSQFGKRATAGSATFAMVRRGTLCRRHYAGIRL